MSLSPLYVDVADFGPHPPKDRDYYFRKLRERYDTQITTAPDLLIYGHGGDSHRLYTCRKLFHSCENLGPDFEECDYAITCKHLDDPRNLRVPYYVEETVAADLVRQPGEWESWKPRKTRFCAFASTYRNAKTKHRWNFFEKLSRYKKVDSIGRADNNIGELIPFDTPLFVKFLHPYKFCMAFENQSAPGYVTEKITRAMRARCIPIYYGCPRVVEEFNPQSFLNYHDFKSEEALIERITEIDRDDRLFEQYFSEPYFHSNEPNIYFEEKRMLDFLDKVVQDKTPPRDRRHALLGRWKLLRRLKSFAK